MVVFSFSLAAGIRIQTYARRSPPSPKAKLADCAYRQRRYLAVRGDVTGNQCNKRNQIIIFPRAANSVFFGFAYPVQSTSSLLASGEAKNLRALHEYPSSHSDHCGRFFILLENRGFSLSSRHFMARIGFAFERKPSGSSLTSGEAKNLRALHEYHSSADHHSMVYFLLAFYDTL